MSATTDDGRESGVEFDHEDDGRITARDIETGVASYGETKAEALAMLAEALEPHDREAGTISGEDLGEFGGATGSMTGNCRSSCGKRSRRRLTVVRTRAY